MTSMISTIPSRSDDCEMIDVTHRNARIRQLAEGGEPIPRLAWRYRLSEGAVRAVLGAETADDRAEREAAVKAVIASAWPRKSP